MLLILELKVLNLEIKNPLQRGRGLVLFWWNLLNDQHSVTIGIETVFFFDCLCIGLFDKFMTCKG